MDRKKHVKRRKGNISAQSLSRRELLEHEKGSYLKKWTGRLPVALFYPNTYRVGMSSLGFQIVYNLLNQDDRIVCERVFCPDSSSSLPVSIESARPLDNFPIIFCSISFEHDYVNVAGLFLSAEIEPYSARRSNVISAQTPLVIFGGVAMFMNPEPLAPFADLIVVGEAEPVLPELVEVLCRANSLEDRQKLLLELNRDHDSFYAPGLYEADYDKRSFFTGFTTDNVLPKRIRKSILTQKDRASHSELLTPDTEFSNLYLTELGRGCSRGCRFCTAGFIYRPSRLWDKEAVLNSLNERPEGINRVGLLGMEMTSGNVLESIAEQMRNEGCTLSFSSLRADRISDGILELLSESKLKSVAIAPDGASERLRKVINKGLSEEDLLDAAKRLVGAGIFKLKLYLMIGLPTETDEDLKEFLLLVEKIKETIDPVGRARGRLCELVVSVNSFVPKAWTPFQYHPFGVSERLADHDTADGKSVVRELKRKISYLKKGLSSLANTHVNFDKPDNVLFQAILARGDRRMADVLLEMAASGISWKQAMKHQGLSETLYATRQYSEDSHMPWEIIDHSIQDAYLWKEYCKAFESKLTVPCDPDNCRRCGVCDD